MPTRIPIKYLANDGSESGPYEKRHPAIETKIHFDPNHGKGLGPRVFSDVTTTNAMIDTGADLNFIDPSLIRSIGSPVHQTATVSGGTSTIASTHHIVHIILPGHPVQIETDVCVAPLRAQGRAYDLILGNLFLKLGTLHLDFKSGIFYFDIGP